MNSTKIKKYPSCYVYLYRYKNKPVYVGLGTNTEKSNNYRRARDTTYHKEILALYEGKELEVSIVVDNLTKLGARAVETSYITQLGLLFKLANKKVSIIKYANYFKLPNIELGKNHKCLIKAKIDEKNSYVYIYKYKNKPVYVGIGTNTEKSKNYLRARQKHLSVDALYNRKDLKITVIFDNVSKEEAKAIETSYITQLDLNFKLRNKMVSHSKHSSYFVLIKGKLVRGAFTTEERKAKKVARKIKQVAYAKSPRGKALRLKSRNRPASKANAAIYRNNPENKARAVILANRPEVKNRVLEQRALNLVVYQESRRTPEARAKQAAYRNNPVVKARIAAKRKTAESKLYHSTYSKLESSKIKRAEYADTEGAKAKAVIRRNKPENKAKKALYDNKNKNNAYRTDYLTKETTKARQKLYKSTDLAKAKAAAYYQAKKLRLAEEKSANLV